MLSQNGVGRTENDCVVKFHNYSKSKLTANLTESFALHFSRRAARQPS